MRWDETWHRLREWTNGQGPSERLAAQVLIREGFENLDPSHPLGGKDGGQDAVCFKNGKKWTMAVYFPNGQQRFSEIKKKFRHDLESVRKNQADGIAFVTNQRLSISERKTLEDLAAPQNLELYHLDRLQLVVDRPDMGGVRRQFLGIDEEAVAKRLWRFARLRWKSTLACACALAASVYGGWWMYDRHAPPSDRLIAEAITQLREARLGSTPPGLGRAVDVLRRAKVALGGENFAGAWLACQDLSDLDLRRVHAPRIHGTGAKFENALLFLANFENGELNAASFRKANMQSAWLSRSNMVGASLRDADARGIRAHGATLQAANLEGADLSSADLSNVDFLLADLRNVNLKDADLNGVNLAQADISGSNFDGTKGLNQEMLNQACINPSNPPKLDEGLSAPTKVCNEENSLDSTEQHNERQIKRTLTRFVVMQEVIQGTCKNGRVEPLIFGRDGKHPDGPVFVPFDVE